MKCIDASSTDSHGIKIRKLPRFIIPASGQIAGNYLRRRKAIRAETRKLEVQTLPSKIRYVFASILRATSNRMKAGELLQLQRWNILFNPWAAQYKYTAYAFSTGAAEFNQPSPVYEIRRFSVSLIFGTEPNVLLSHENQAE